MRGHSYTGSLVVDLAVMSLLSKVSDVKTDFQLMLLGQLILSGLIEFQIEMCIVVWISKREGAACAHTWTNHWVV